MKIKKHGETVTSDKPWIKTNPLEVGYKNPNSIAVKVILQDDEFVTRYRFQKLLNPSGISSRIETELKKVIKIYFEFGIIAAGDRTGFSLNFSGNREDYDRYIRLMLQKGWGCYCDPSGWSYQRKDDGFCYSEPFRFTIKQPPERLKRGKALAQVDISYSHPMEQGVESHVLWKEVKVPELPEAIAQAQAIYWSLDQYEDCTISFGFSMTSNTEDERQGNKDFSKMVDKLGKLGWTTPDNPRLAIVKR